ncbi:GFA family protein [Aliidongia dinghuensis]|uniref:hypothetical protein n=1 Tax=Aliidongia dinghuensis TaxID=1867774 RepID=UPI001E2DF84B|nr:hypothetical protein [Aliidongia dinghuensis]
MPHEHLRVTTWANDIGRYLFGKQTIAHRFCRTCRIYPFGEDAVEGPGRKVYINIRCLDGVDPASVAMIEYDGRSF